MRKPIERLNFNNSVSAIQMPYAWQVIFASSLLLWGCAGPTPKYDPTTHTNTKVEDFHKGTLRPYTVRGKTYHPYIPEKGFSETGIASWYGYESPNLVTANGEKFNTDTLTAAHKTFPLPSLVEVTNLDNGKKITVRVNDRGPFADGRIIDLSRASAKALGVYSTGTAHVKIKWLGFAPSLISSDSPPLSEEKIDAHDQYIVQLGAYGVKDNAVNAQNRLSDTKIMKKDSLFIVYLGPFDTANQAERERQHAISAGFTTAIIRAK